MQIFESDFSGKSRKNRIELIINNLGNNILENSAMIHLGKARWNKLIGANLGIITNIKQIIKLVLTSYT